MDRPRLIVSAMDRSVVLERLGGDGGAHPLAEHGGLHASRRRRDDGELAAADARHGVLGAAGGRQDFGEPDQNLVADLVTVLFVDGAEIIDVNANDRQVAVMAVGISQVLHAALDEITPAVQLRERVDRRLLFERGGGFLQPARGLVELGVRPGAREQLHAVNRLDDEIGGAAGERAFTRQLVVGAGDDDDGDIANPLGFRGANAADERIAVELGHLDVGNQNLDGIVLEQVLPRGFAVFDLDQLEFVAQDLVDGLADDARVVRHQHPHFVGDGRGNFHFFRLHFHVLTHSRNGPYPAFAVPALHFRVHWSKHSAGPSAHSKP